MPRATFGLALASVATTILVAAGCQSFQLPEPEPAPEVTIAVPEGRLCAGMEPWVDAELERVQAHVGLTLERSLFVELGQAAVDEGCGNTPEDSMRLGCTVGVGQDVRVYTRPEALAHELVHALRRQWELKTVPFLEEGWAETVAGSDVLPSIALVDPRAVEVDLEALLGASVEEMRDPFARMVATHVVRFIESSVGPDALAAFFRGGTDDDGEGAAIRLEVALGTSFTTWATRWSAEAQPVSGRGDPCTSGVLDVPADGVELASTVDCDAPDTFGIAGDASGAWTRQCVRVDAPGMWQAQVTATAGRVRIAAVPGTCAAETPSTAMAPREIEPGAALATVLGACTYTAVFEVVEDVPTAMVLSLSPPV
jgi:hypothetical protein